MPAGGDAVQRRLRRPLPDPCLCRGLRVSDASGAGPPRREVADTLAAGVSASGFGEAGAPSSAGALALLVAAPSSAAAGASTALSSLGAAGASGVTLLPNAVGTSGGVLSPSAAEGSAGALSSAFAGADDASVAVSLPVVAVSVSAFAELELAGLTLLLAFAVSSVIGVLSGWRAGDGAALGGVARGAAGFLSSGLGDASGAGATASAGDDVCGLPFVAGPSWAGRGRASAGVRSAAACGLPEPSAKDLPLPKGRVSGSWVGSSPSGAAGASPCDGAREAAAGRGGDTGPRAAAKPARR